MNAPGVFLSQFLTFHAYRSCFVYISVAEAPRPQLAAAAPPLRPKMERMCRVCRHVREPPVVRLLNCRHHDVHSSAQDVGRVAHGGAVGKPVAQLHLTLHDPPMHVGVVRRPRIAEWSDSFQARPPAALLWWTCKVSCRRRSAAERWISRFLRSYRRSSSSVEPHAGRGDVVIWLKFAVSKAWAATLHSRPPSKIS